MKRPQDQNWDEAIPLSNMEDGTVPLLKPTELEREIERLRRDKFFTNSQKS